MVKRQEDGWKEGVNERNDAEEKIHIKSGHFKFPLLITCLFSCLSNYPTQSFSLTGAHRPPLLTTLHHNLNISDFSISD